VNERNIPITSTVEQLEMVAFPGIGLKKVWGIQSKAKSPDFSLVLINFQALGIMEWRDDLVIMCVIPLFYAKGNRSLGK
jgi:hypothetical protein